MVEYKGSKVRIRENEDNDQYGYSNLLGTITCTVLSKDDPTMFEVELETGIRDDFRLDELEFLDCIEDDKIDPKEHSLVFVQQEAGMKWRVFQDGVEVEGMKSIDINADIDYPTEHTIKYSTGTTKSE
jgi:hypothetical protein